MDFDNAPYGNEPGDQEFEVFNGATFPGLYAMMAHAHMAKYGTTRDMLSAVAVKNHKNGAKNPVAQYPFEIPIGAAGAGVIRGIAVAADAILVLLSRTSETAIAKLSGVWPSFLPVSDLACRPQENGAVVLSWRNNGSGLLGAYTELSILRDGTAIAQLGGDAFGGTASLPDRHENVAGLRQRRLAMVHDDPGAWNALLERIVGEGANEKVVAAASRTLDTIRQTPSIVTASADLAHSLSFRPSRQP